MNVVLSLVILHASSMADDLTTLKQIKYDTETKKFLKDASAMIELVNLVDNFRLGKTKLSECRVCKVNEHNEAHRHRQSRGPHRRPHPHAGADDGPRARRAVRRRNTELHKPDLTNSSAIRCKKHIEASQKTKQLKRISKCQLEILTPNIDKEIKLELLEPKTKKRMKDKRDGKKHSEKRVRPEILKKESARTVKKEIRRMLSSNLEMTNVQIQSLNDTLCLHDKKNENRTAIVLLPKTDNSKRSLRTTKYNSTNSFLLNNNSTKRSKKNNTYSRKTVIKKPSLHLLLNLTLKPNSNTIKMQIESKIKTPKSRKTSELNVLSIRFPSKSSSCSYQKRKNKMLKKHLKLSTSTTKPGVRSASQSLNDQKLDNRYPNVRFPYHKTQAVYNVYDMAPYEQPRQIQGIKSHVSLNLNFGNPPPSEQVEDGLGGPGSITQNGRHAGKPCRVRYKNKMNYQNGLTSLQQSLSLGRSYPQSESYPSDFETQPCDCDEPGVSDGEDTCDCDTCCLDQDPLPEPEPNMLENCLCKFKRTKRRIVERVTNVSREASSMVLAPGAFMGRVKDKYRAINTRAEKRLKDEGSCTCRPFIDTDRVSVCEENDEPECSFFKRHFGSLLYNDKCIVCSQTKPITDDKCTCSQTKAIADDKCVCVCRTKATATARCVKGYICTPIICKPAEESGLLACLKKLCIKCYTDWNANKCEKENKKLKDQIKKLKQKKKEKKKKKGSPVCKFLTSIFKKDDDKRKLLKKAKKVRKHRNGDGGGKGGGTPGVDTKKGAGAGGHQFKRASRRICERYHRNKKLAEQQRGRFACDFYLLSLRNRPCLWVYYMCPWCYPHCLQALNLWRQISDLLLFFVAIIVWSPCILAAEVLKVMACNLW